MTLRISSKFQTDLFVNQILEQQRGLADLRQEAVTGLKVIEASDSPGPAGVISQLQTIVTRLKGHKDRMSYAENILTQQEGILTNSSEIMVRAKEIATQAANETYSAEQRQSLATEVWALRRAMVSNANTQVLGKYIFGGNDDDDPPYDLIATPYTNPAGPAVDANQRYVYDAEQGTAGVKSVRITDGERVVLTPAEPAPGVGFFQASIDALDRLGRTLEGYRTTPELVTAAPDLGGVAYNLPTEMRDQTNAILNSIDQITAANRTLQTEISSIGGWTSRIAQARQITDVVIENTEANRSQLQDADIAETASNLSTLQNGYQALLAAGSQINRLSLLDFL